MQEYKLVKLNKKYQNLYHDYPYIVSHFSNFEGNETSFLQQQYQLLFEDLSNYNTIIHTVFKNRKDYRKQENLYCIKNEMTKEISIIIIKRYQIVAKCDKIANVLIDTLLGIDPDLVILNSTT